MKKIINKIAEQIYSEFPSVDVEIPEGDIILSHGGDEIIEVFNVPDEKEVAFLSYTSKLIQDYLWPKDIFNIVFLPHTVSNTIEFYPEKVQKNLTYACEEEIETPFVITASLAGAIAGSDHLTNFSLAQGEVFFDVVNWAPMFMDASLVVNASFPEEIFKLDRAIFAEPSVAYTGLLEVCSEDTHTSDNTYALAA
jgi:hypothetical protein